MTITSVILGDGTPEGGWGEAWVCPSTDAAGSIVIRRGKSSFMVYLDSVAGGISLAYLIFARGTRSVTRLRMIDFWQESGHKRASRSKEFNSERRRSGTSRPDDPLSGRITGSISGDLRAARAGSAPVSVAFGRRLRNRR